MRLLQLATGPDELLDLHPNLTVVTGLDDDAHRKLVAAVAGLARAEAPAGGGLLEAHGVLFDLDPAMLAVLELDAEDLDPVVRPGQLPGQPISVDARELRAREQAFNELLAQIAARVERQAQARTAVQAAADAVAQARRTRADAEMGAARRFEELDRLTQRLDELGEQRRRLDDDLAAARQELADTSARRTELEASTAQVRAARDAAVARREALEVELRELESTIDPGTADEVERLTGDLRAVEQAVAAERAQEEEERARRSSADAGGDDEDEEDQEPPEVRLERLEERVRELDQLLVVLVPVERLAVEAALAELEGGDGVDLVPSAEAGDLADELDRVDADLAAAVVTDVPPGALAAARTRLEDAQHLLAEAELALRNPELDRQMTDRLEDVHEEILEALDRADRRFGGRGAQDRVTELRAVEQDLLDRLGFASYSDYLMGHSLIHVDPAKEAALDAARLELGAAEDDWRRLQAATEAALSRAEVLDRRRALLDKARSLLGSTAPGPRPQEALRALLVPAVSADQAAERLHAALSAAGLDLGDEELDHEELALIASTWLDEAEQVQGRRHGAAEERERLEVERREVLAALEAVRPAAADAQVEPVLDPEEQRRQRLAEARERVAAAEEAWLRSESALERRESLLVELEQARTLEHAAGEGARGADEALDAVWAIERPQVDRVAWLESELQEAAAASADADEALRRLSVDEVDLGELDHAIDVAEAAYAEAIGALEAEDGALAALDAEGRAAALEIERLQDIVATQDTGEATPADELEWYLLARLAAQRAVSVAGSLPLLLDGALRGLDSSEVDHLLGRLEPMAEAVQLIIVSDDPVIAAWANRVGPARAAVVRPTAA